jgi:hypothetical protein
MEVTMAANTTVTLNPFKRGDTPTFRFEFSNPYTGFDWSGITADCAMTDIENPNDNTGAAATRLNQPLQTSSTGAYYEFTLTIVESKALAVETQYKVEIQLKQGTTVVVTPVTANVKVLQDYII